MRRPLAGCDLLGVTVLSAQPNWNRHRIKVSIAAIGSHHHAVIMSLASTSMSGARQVGPLTLNPARSLGGATAAGSSS